MNIAKTKPNKNKAMTYFMVNGVFYLIIAVMAGMNPSDFSALSVPYVCLLFSLCSLPIIIAKNMNGRYAILNLFALLYLVFYSAADLLEIIFPIADVRIITNNGFLTETEVAALLGIAMYIMGYCVVAKNYRDKKKKLLDWKHGFRFKFGIILWFAGLVATWIWQFEYADLLHGKKEIRGNFVIVFILLRMLQPLGTAMIIYSYLTKRSIFMLAIVMGILAVEFVFGFVADSKELSIRAFVILLMFYVLLYGKVPKKWLTIAICLFAMTFSIFQAYRQAIFHDRDQSRQEALTNLSANLDKVLASSEEGQGRFRAGIDGFVGRMNLKANLEMVITRTGADVQYQNGYTIGLLFYVLIPRFIMPDKPDSAVGQLFNRQFKVSEDPDTYISATHLAELYWNYSWTGLIIGMFVIGLVMGFAGSSWSLRDRPNLVNALLIFSTLYLLCFRFEAGIAIQYTLWIRSILLIFLMNYLVKLLGFTQQHKKTNKASVAIKQQKLL